MNKEKQIEEMSMLLTEGARPAIEDAEKLYDAGYAKASDVALEAVDDFQSKLRNTFLDMCEDNDYNTLNLLQIDSAIETLFESFIAKLKKKYTEGVE